MITYKRGDTNTTRFYVLFSKNGFTKDMLSMAKKEGVFLFRKDKWVV